MQSIRTALIGRHRYQLKNPLSCRASVLAVRSDAPRNGDAVDDDEEVRLSGASKIQSRGGQEMVDLTHMQPGSVARAVPQAPHAPHRLLRAGIEAERPKPQHHHHRSPNARLNIAISSTNTDNLAFYEGDLSH